MTRETIPLTLLRAFIERAEVRLASAFPQARTLRCRVTARGVGIEADPLPGAAGQAAVEEEIRALCSEAQRPFAGLRAYRRGSAFLHATGEAASAPGGVCPR